MCVLQFLDIMLCTMSVRYLKNRFCSIHSYSVMKVLVNHVRQVNYENIYERNNCSRYCTAMLSQCAPKTGSEKQGLNEESMQAKRKPRKVKTSHSKEIMNYLLEKELLSHIASIMPLKIMKRKRVAPEALYLVDGDVARQFVNAIALPTNQGYESVVVEANPGIGLLSKELLDAGVNRLHLYEPCNTFLPHLRELEKQHPGKIQLHCVDIFSLWKLAFQDKMDDGSRVNEILARLPKRHWADDPAVKIIGTLPTVNFIRHLIMSIAFQTGIMMNGRPELYLALPPPIYFHLASTCESGHLLYRSLSVLFQLFFEYELLSKLPRKPFFPWTKEIILKKYSKLPKSHLVDADYLYLVKIIPRRDLYENIAPAEKLQPLWYFIRHHFRSRRNRIIPQLEQWIPGCGTRLILEDMNIFSQFGDMTPQEVLELFHKFTKWPEYPHSPFIASMETAFLKMEQSIVKSRILDEVQTNESQEEEEEDESEINVRDPVSREK